MIIIFSSSTMVQVTYAARNNDHLSFLLTLSKCPAIIIIIIIIIIILWSSSPCPTASASAQPQTKVAADFNGRLWTWKLGSKFAKLFSPHRYCNNVSIYCPIYFPSIGIPTQTGAYSNILHSRASVASYILRLRSMPVTPLKNHKFEELIVWRRNQQTSSFKH